MGKGNFTEDFKLDANKQITQRGHSVADVSQRLGVSTHSLYGWIKRYGASAGAAVKDDQPAATRRLKRELARVTEERGILKKLRWIQLVSATLSASLAPGVKKPRVFRGRVLSLSATASRTSWL